MVSRSGAGVFVAIWPGFSIQPQTFVLDMAKISYIVSFLQVIALAWAEAVISSNPI